MEKDYLEEGDVCPIEDCIGIMVYKTVENCSCHISPPCWACTNNPLVCIHCGHIEEDK